jgi:hypothetical protein
MVSHEILRLSNLRSPGLRISFFFHNMLPAALFTYLLIDIQLFMIP